MASKMKVLLKGYSGYAQIDKRNVLMTSFSLSMNENILQSQGVGKLYYENNGNGHFTRYKMNAVRDYPGYEFSIGIEADYGTLDHFLKKITEKFHAFVNVKFEDRASGILYEFDKCCLTSFSMSVNTDSVAMASFSFVTFKDEIEVKYCKKGYDRNAGRNAPGAEGYGSSKHGNADGDGNLVGAVLMPYWAWGIETTDSYGKYLNDDDLYEFSVSYSQQVIPKYGCHGVQSDKAPEPTKIIFGVPEVKYELTYVVANSLEASDYLIRSNKVAVSERDIKVKFKQKHPKGAIVGSNSDGEEFEFKMTDCYPDSYSPQVGNKDDVNKISVSGTVYGKIEYD